VYDEEAAAAAAVDFAVDAIGGAGVLRQRLPRPLRLRLTRYEPSPVDPLVGEKRGELPLPEVAGPMRRAELRVEWMGTRARGGVLSRVEISVEALRLIGEFQHDVPSEPGDRTERVWRRVPPVLAQSARDPPRGLVWERVWTSVLERASERV
jgi:hypothetical protein